MFDQEHTGWTLDQIRSLLAAARAADTVPLVRVRTLDQHAIGQVLALGALGVMVPLIRDATEAKQVAAAAKYPPRASAASGSSTSTSTAATSPATCATPTRS